MTFFLAPLSDQAATYNPTTAPYAEKLNHLVTAKWNGHKMMWIQPSASPKQAHRHSPTCIGCRHLPPPFPGTVLYFFKGEEPATVGHEISLITNIPEQQRIWATIPMTNEGEP